MTYTQWNINTKIKLKLLNNLLSTWKLIWNSHERQIKQFILGFIVFVPTLLFINILNYLPKQNKRKFNRV